MSPVSLRPVLTLALNACLLLAAMPAVADSAIGLGLVTGEDPWSLSLAAGADEAVAAINRRGGIHGRIVKLQTLPAAQPWRAGTAEIARMAGAGDTVALLGAVDGAAAHVAAQVATRLRLPLLTVSPEVNLTQAGATGVFRLVDDDATQARKLLASLPGGASGRRALLIVPDGREGRQRLAALRQACDASSITIQGVVEVGTMAVAPPAPADVVLLWLDAEAARALLASWKPDMTTTTILGSTRLCHSSFLETAPPGIHLAGGHQNLPRLLGRDLVNLLTDALMESAGGDLRATLAGGFKFTGETGAIMFDATGSRSSKVRPGAFSAER